MRYTLLIVLTICMLAGPGLAQELAPDDLKIFQKGQDAFAEENFGEAAAIFSLFLEKHPENTQARINRGNAYLRMEKWDKAEADLKTALKADPKNAVALSSMGVLLLHRQNYEQAYLRFQEAARHSEAERKANLLYLSGRSAYGWGRLDLAHLDWLEAERRGFDAATVCIDYYVYPPVPVNGEANIALLPEVRKVLCLNLSDKALENLGKLEFLELLDAGAAPGRALKHTFTAAGWKALANSKTLTSLNLSGCGITDDMLEQIGTISSLKSLDLSGNPDITDKGLRFLSGLSGLEQLSIDECAGIQGVDCTGLEKLTSLYLLTASNNPQLQNGFLKAIGSLPELGVLALENARGLTHDGFMCLQTPALQMLSIHNTRPERFDWLHVEGRHLLALSATAIPIDESSVGTLAGSTPIDTLEISWAPKVNDELLKVIGSIQGLGSLSIESCHNISDAGIASIAESGVHILKLTDCRGVTGSGFKAFEGRGPLALHLNRMPGLTIDGLASLESVMLSLLRLNRCKTVTSEFTDTLASIDFLHKLEILETPALTDALLHRISTLGRLDSIVIADSSGDLSDDGISALSKCENLESIEITSPTISGEGFSNLTDLPSLNSISLNNCTGLTREGVMALSSLEHLESLQLDGCNLEDLDLEQLKASATLTTLEIQRSHKLSTDGLRKLASTGGLKTLIVDNLDALTAELLRELRRRIPKCRVNHPADLDRYE